VCLLGGGTARLGAATRVIERILRSTPHSHAARLPAYLRARVLTHRYIRGKQERTESSRVVGEENWKTEDRKKEGEDKFHRWDFGE